MQRKLVLNLLIVIALVTFPAAAFANGQSSPAQDGGSDLHSTISRTPADQVIHQGDQVSFSVHISNDGTDDAVYSDEATGGLPIAELILPGSLDLDSDNITLPDGMTCLTVAIGDAAGPVIGAAFPGYNLTMCHQIEGTEFTLAAGQSIDLTFPATANVDVSDGSYFVSAGLALNDPDFEVLYTAMQNGENPFDVNNPSDMLDVMTYSSTPVTTTTEPPTTTTQPDPNTISDVGVTGSLRTDNPQIHSGDTVNIDMVEHNYGPADLIDPDGNSLFFEFFYPPEFTLDSIAGIDGMTCNSMSFHDMAPGSTIDISYPGYKMTVCNTPPQPGFEFPNGGEVTVTATGTATADFVDGSTTFYGVGVVGSDPDLTALETAFMTNQDPFLIDVNNIARITYSYQVTPSTQATNPVPTTAGAKVLGEQETNSSGSLSGSLPFTGAETLTIIVIALILLAGGIIMITASRKKQSGPLGH